MSDCSYAAISNHKLTVANLCVKSNSMWTNFADNGKIHTCMYNVCTLYTTAVGVISPRQLACFRYAFCSLRSHGTRDKAGSIIDRCYRERVSVEVFCSLRSHGTRLLLTQQSNPCLGHGKCEGRAITYEQLFICQTHVERLQSLIFATNGKIGRFEFAP